MKKPKQLELPIYKPKSYFGGSLLHGKRRALRPLSSKEALHLVIRSSWAFGKNSFLKNHNKPEIERLIGGIARKYFIKVYRKGIASNHIHLVIKFNKRSDYKIFIRVLTSKIASHVMKQQSFKVFKASILKERWGDPPDSRKDLSRSPDPTKETQGLEQAFWQFRPFTRILKWGRDFKQACAYVVQNTLEALGFIPYKPRTDYYKKYRGCG